MSHPHPHRPLFPQRDLWPLPLQVGLLGWHLARHSSETLTLSVWGLRLCAPHLPFWEKDVSLASPCPGVGQHGMCSTQNFQPRWALPTAPAGLRELEEAFESPDGHLGLHLPLTPPPPGEPHLSLTLCRWRPRPQPLPASIGLARGFSPWHLVND